MIGNLSSRRTAELFSLARAELTARGIFVAESHVVRGGRALRESALAAVKSPYDIIIIGGGDGSLTTVVGAFAHSQAVLGVLPLGTGNSFARSLGIVPDLEHAIDAIVDGKIAHVDLGVVNGTHFANFATIGLSSQIARSTPSLLKRIFGPAAYALAGIMPLLRSRSFGTKISFDGRKRRVRTHQLIVASGRYYGLTPLLPDATIVDGTLAVFTTSGLSRWDVAKAFLALLSGNSTRLTDAEYFYAKELVVKTKPKQFLDIDGEALGRTPAHFTVDPGALRVMVPQGFTGT